MRIAYIQPIGGASGDMMLGALADLGMPIEHLEAELGKLKVFFLGVSGETVSWAVGGLSLHEAP